MLVSNQSGQTNKIFGGKEDIDLDVSSREISKQSQGLMTSEGSIWWVIGEENAAKLPYVNFVAMIGTENTFSTSAKWLKIGRTKFMELKVKMGDTQTQKGE